jgi:hypothetical protein
MQQAGEGHQYYCNIAAAALRDAQMAQARGL